LSSIIHICHAKSMYLCKPWGRYWGRTVAAFAGSFTLRFFVGSIWKYNAAHHNFSLDADIIFDTIST